MPPPSTRRSKVPRPTPLDRSSEINRTISHAVNVLMADREIERPELAAVLGYSAVSTISRSLAGHRQWSIEDVLRMAELFDVDIRQLLGLDNLVVRNRCFRQGEFAFAA